MIYNTELHRLLDYCQSATFILIQDGENISVHRKWFVGLLKYANSAEEELKQEKKEPRT